MIAKSTILFFFVLLFMFMFTLLMLMEFGTIIGALALVSSWKFDDILISSIPEYPYRNSKVNDTSTSTMNRLSRREFGFIWICLCLVSCGLWSSHAKYRENKHFPYSLGTKSGLWKKYVERMVERLQCIQTSTSTQPPTNHPPALKKWAGEKLSHDSILLAS